MQETSFGIPLTTPVRVNADLTGKQKRYIQVRMEQLKEDMEKAHDEHDKKWYNRCIQELDWVCKCVKNLITTVTWRSKKWK